MTQGLFTWVQPGRPGYLPQQPVTRDATLLFGRYRVNVRPRYVTRYKTVTQLEWRCCPGFRGGNCQEGPRDPGRMPRPMPARPRNSMKKPTGNSLLSCAQLCSSPLLLTPGFVSYMQGFPRASKNTPVCLQEARGTHIDVQKQ